MSDIGVMGQAQRLGDHGVNSGAWAQRSQMVKVYAFEAYDPLREQAVRAPCKMTMSDILSWRGVPIQGTEQEVPADMLDDNGRFYPDD